jgi:hypothetical protein
LQQTFSKQDERVTHDRLLKRIVDDIEDSTKGSGELVRLLLAWKEEVKFFETAVQAAQGKKLSAWHLLVH